MSEWDDHAIDRLNEALRDDEAGEVVWQNRGLCCWAAIGIVLLIALVAAVVYVLANVGRLL